MKQISQFCNMEYHKDTTKISKSGLDLIHKSPLHYWERYLNPGHVEKKTPALLLGSAVHCAVLEPQEFGKRYAIAPNLDRRTKDGKQRYEEFIASVEGLEIISPEDAIICERIAEAARRHPQAGLLLSKITQVEQVFTHDDKKCKPDALTSLNICLDLKTTEDASPYAFGRSAMKYRYDVQAAFYIDILEANNIPCEGFVFIAVEKTAPFAVACYVIEDADIQAGRQKYQEDYIVWKQCTQLNEWPGYNGLAKLQLPNYGK
jgi:exodeoxyribonuclease VIII